MCKRGAGRHSLKRASQYLPFSQDPEGKCDFSIITKRLETTTQILVINVHRTTKLPGKQYCPGVFVKVAISKDAFDAPSAPRPHGDIVLRYTDATRCWIADDNPRATVHRTEGSEDTRSLTRSQCLPGLTLDL